MKLTLFCPTYFNRTNNFGNTKPTPSYQFYIKKQEEVHLSKPSAETETLTPPEAEGKKMAKSMRSKREKRLRAIRREIVEPFYEKKDEAKFAAQEAALAAPKLPVRSPKTNSMEIATPTATSTADNNMGKLLISFSFNPFISFSNYCLILDAHLMDFNLMPYLYRVLTGFISFAHLVFMHIILFKYASFDEVPRFY